MDQFASSLRESVEIVRDTEVLNEFGNVDVDMIHFGRQQTLAQGDLSKMAEQI